MEEFGPEGEVGGRELEDWRGVRGVKVGIEEGGDNGVEIAGRVSDYDGVGGDGEEGAPGAEEGGEVGGAREVGRHDVKKVRNDDLFDKVEQDQRGDDRWLWWGWEGGDRCASG